MKNNFIRIAIFMAIFCFFVSIIPGTFAAYWTTSFSADGKSLHVSTSHVTSTLNTNVKTVKKTGSYGYGTYTNVVVKGKDDKGRTVYRAITYFNGILKTSTSALKSQSYTSSSKVTKNSKGYTQTDTGSISKTTYSGSANIQAKIINNQLVPFKGAGIMRFWNAGVYQGKTIYTSTPSYKKFGTSYILVGAVDKYSFIYSNGDTRSVLLYRTYLRKTDGSIAGKKTTGKSSGVEKVNGKWVKYTGIIKYGYRYDARDLWNDKYSPSSYQETKTSTSQNLVKRLPIIEFLIDT